MDRKPKAVVAIGVPGSGKSTIMREFSNRNGYEYLDYDQIRQERPDLVAALEHDKLALWNYIRDTARRLFSEGKTVVFDATFAGFTFRRKFVEFLRDAGAFKVEGVFVDVVPEIAIERAAARLERTVGEDSIRYYQGLLSQNRPDISDGFDALFEMDDNARFRQVYIRDRLQDGLPDEYSARTRYSVLDEGQDGSPEFKIR